MFSLISHGDYCTPANRCHNCKVATFLKKNLAPEQFIELLGLVHPAVPVAEPVPLLDTPDYDTPLAELVPFQSMSQRTGACLKNDNIITIRNLVERSEAEMLRLPYFGRKGLNEVKTLLALYEGLRLGM